MQFLRRLVGHIQVPLLLSRGRSRVVWSLYSFINGFVTIGLLSLVAYFAKVPFIFPSLGPTAFLVFYTPELRTAAPRNVVLGHLVGALAGYVSLRLFGLAGAPPSFLTGVDLHRAGAVALALAVTNGAMVALRVAHPPAAATTMIFAMGIMRAPFDLAVLMLAVCAMVALAIAINRLAGLPYPFWNPTVVERQG